MNRLKVAAILSANFIFLIRVAAADVATIGPEGIDSASLGLTGAGISIGQVEVARPGDADAGDDAANRNSTVNPTAVFVQDGPAVANMNINNHAESVAGVMISTHQTATGVATGAQLYSSAVNPQGGVFDFEIALSMQHIANQDNFDVRAINFSAGISLEGGMTDGSSTLTKFVDWSAVFHNVLYVISGDQVKSEPPATPIPKDNYNGITVAASEMQGGVYRRVAGFNVTTHDAVGARTSVDLIAPGDDVVVTRVGDNIFPDFGTSLAAPHVTGTVALLQQNADTVNEQRQQVMKAVLLNSADKIEGIMGMERTVTKKNGMDDWFDTAAYTDPAIPLDIEMGAGHLNANRAHTQFAAGEQSPGGVSDIGWDYFFQNDPFIPNRYTLNLEANDFVSATLVWNREVLLNSPFPDYQAGDEFIDNGFANLDLYLVPAGMGIEQAVAKSTSTEENLEHFFAQVDEPGPYELQVWIGELNQVFYAVAWWAGADERPEGAPGDFNSDGGVDAADYVAWRKTDNSQGGYDDFYANFGTVGSGAGGANVPEAGGLVLALSAVFGAGVMRGCRFC